MKPLEEKLYQVLKEKNFVEAAPLEDAYQTAKQLKKPLMDILIFRGLIAEEAISELLAASFQVPHAALKNYLIPDEVLNLIPESLARRYRMIIFEKNDRGVCLAMDDPRNFEALEIVKRRLGDTVLVYFATGSEITRALNQYRRDIRKQFRSIIETNVKKAGAVKADVSLEKLMKVASDLPVVKILDTVLEYAAAENASDLHFETLQDSLMIRLRIDGILQDVIALPREIQPAIVARIKVLSNLKLDEHRIPQDGRFKFQMDEAVMGIRVSIIPAFYGENVVLRLLAESARPLSLEELGLTGSNLELVKRNIKKPYGMVLVTGPTGCGKTTTLYSALNILNTIRVKICTVEDPIEYSIGRVNQIQINLHTGLDFAAGLRALLRHDPDIIMVGEIRDSKTVSMAIHSSLTGHLVLSTLHTNDAPSAIPRLLDMGAEGYLLASTVNLVIAQRLVRRICPNCTQEDKPSQQELEHLQKIVSKTLGKQKFYRGKGCDKCHQTGYRGRVGIFEVMEINEAISKLTLAKASVEMIRQAAIKSGMKTMLEDGFDKIGAGLTTVEEVIAAVKY